MAQSTAGRSIWRWFGATLTLTLGGLLYSYAVLWLIQAALDVMNGGRVLVNPGEFNLGVMVICGLLVSLISVPLLRWIGRLGGGQAWLTIFGWGGVLALLWLISQLTRSGLTLPVYAAVFLLFGGLAGLLVAGGQARSAASRRGQRAGAGGARSAQTIARSDQFGRIPAATVTLLAQQVQLARGRIAGALPAGASAQVRAFTSGAVLDRTLQDWWENGNLAGLNDADVDDLRSFVALAASLAGPLGLSSAEGLAVYRATLNILLDDWLEHWNDQQPGPPPR